MKNKIFVIAFACFIFLSGCTSTFVNETPKVADTTQTPEPTITTLGIGASMVI